MTTTDLRIEQDGKILKVLLNRPAKKNALTSEMYRGLITAMEEADSNPDIHCLFLSGSEDCFCAGNDLQDFLEQGFQAAADFVRVISRVEKPIVAAVNGPVVGVGATMLLHCDLVVAAEEAYFLMPFVDLGLCAEAGASYLLPLISGYRKAAKLILLGERIDAEKALELGLINRVCSAETYRKSAWEMAQRLSAKPQRALLATKALMREPQAGLTAQAIERENKQFEILLSSDEARKIMGDFLKT